jgi:hypothetical protein
MGPIRNPRMGAKVDWGLRYRTKVENNDQGQKSMKNNEIQFIYTLCGQHNSVYMKEGVP